MKFTFIAAKTGDFPVAWMCRRLGVSTSGYYAWRHAGPAARVRVDEELKLRIRAISKANLGVYGSPRIYLELVKEGVKTSRKRVARLMREAGITGLRKRRFKRTTDSKHGLRVAENVVRRDFNPIAANQVWVSDITYVETWDGSLYLAVIIDLFSRRVVGWAIANNMRTTLVLSALKQATDLRKPAPGLVHHSDRGSQYASDDFRQALEAKGMICSMSRKGDCWDNAVAESFFGTLKQELLYRHPWPSKRSAITAITDYIERFYNPRRRHSYLGYMSPIEFELESIVRLVA